MKKVKFMIVAAGLLATTCTLHSCKKESVKPTTTTANKSGKSNARLLTATEAETAILNSNAFMNYVESFVVNPSTQVPATIPSEFSDNEVVTYLENGFNFSYVGKDLELVNEITDDYTLVISKNANNKATIQNTATGFKAVFDHIKPIYDGISGSANDKIIAAVDVSIVSANNSSVTLKIHTVILHDRISYPGGGAPSGITFPTADEWYIEETHPSGHAKKGDPTSDKYGANVQIARSIKGDWIGPLKPEVYPAPKWPRYIATNLYTVDGVASVGGTTLKMLAANGSSYFLGWDAFKWTSQYITPSNPWNSVLSCTPDHDALMFGQYEYKSTSSCSGEWVPGNAMNYSATHLTTILKSRETAVNKSLWYFSIMAENGGTTKMDYSINWDIYADIIDLFSMPVVKHFPPTGSPMSM